MFATDEHGISRKDSVFFSVVQWRMIGQLFYATDEHGILPRMNREFCHGNARNCTERFGVFRCDSVADDLAIVLCHG
jgi:hypothetical protein